jgi:hypothetical protein
MHAACILGDRAAEIALGLDRGVADAGGQSRQRGAAAGAVDQGQRPAAMHVAHWIEEVLSGLALEDGEAVADLRQPECQRPGDRRGRQPAFDEPLQNLPPREARDVRLRRHAIVENHARAH